MLQSILTAAIELTFASSLVLFGIAFIHGYASRKPAAVPEVAISDDELISALAAIAAELKPEPIADAVVPFVRPQPKSATVEEMNWAALNPFQLRNACSEHGIQWRNAHGKNRHLKKSEMVAVLKEVIAA